MIDQSSSVTFIYIVEIAENPKDDRNHHTVKIDLSGWSFWGKKGLKTLEADGTRIDVYWDFRQAKFSNVPEPSSGFYVALVSQDVVVLTIGDLVNEAMKRTRKRPSAREAALVCKKEHVYGKRVFYTRTAFDGTGRREHEVVIETSLSGPEEPEMWITVDGVAAMRVMNLNWRFRGNEVVTVKEGVAVEIYWDIHDWLFGSCGSSCGLFVFKQKLVSEGRSLSFNGGVDENEGGEDSLSEYCYVLYAVRVD
ncbi:PREDICTED: uncharacterized protein LOC104822715 isoform X2 [Tarenaya hassleriana]|uniref:uncharacterized protein LOC104822715 isoform X2 n=1 Tax=Tarenaya hassleriana TaxID=28532 RepID=UPI00053C7E6F|nr:PREDICTED: uncharacterized protein LOC104822715 isoform X2 [Tarenaya hassleriana]